ncbi:Fic family protein [Mycobacterium sp. M26]|uniref:Fic/DOC family protein n=1 Tax=Mycobacterium sp. M26 TaxID=1762962 RepID=UPI00073E9401|nr:Fic family protein [Mycobacterium sp. M26]
MDPRDRLSPQLRHGLQQAVAAQRLEGWRPGEHHLATLTELMAGERTFADYLAEHRVRHPPPQPARRQLLRRRRPYLIPGTTMLRNNFGTDSAEVLADLEFVATAGRTAQWHQHLAAGAAGTEDLDVCALHQQVFADVYAWAGRLRVTELRRGETVFAWQADLADAVAELDARARDVPADLDPADTARLAYECARWYADYNQVHPFREGNGRTGTLLLHTLAALCGHRLDLSTVGRNQWYAASRDSMPFRRGGTANHRPFLPVFLHALSAAE